MIATFATGSPRQAIFVVDNSGNYRGAITRKDLLRWAAINIIGGESSRSMTIGHMRAVLFASDASGQMRGEASVPVVSDSTNLAKALQLMMDSGETLLPVVDGDGKLIGDLRVSEILNAALNYEEARQ